MGYPIQPQEIRKKTFRGKLSYNDRRTIWDKIHLNKQLLECLKELEAKNLQGRKRPQFEHKIELFYSKEQFKEDIEKILKNGVFPMFLWIEKEES